MVFHHGSVPSFQRLNRTHHGFPTHNTCLGCRYVPLVLIRNWRVVRRKIGRPWPTFFFIRSTSAFFRFTRIAFLQYSQRLHTAARTSEKHNSSRRSFGQLRRLRHPRKLTRRTRRICLITGGLLHYRFVKPAASLDGIERRLKSVRQNGFDPTASRCNAAERFMQSDLALETYDPKGDAAYVKLPVMPPSQELGGATSFRLSFRQRTELIRG